MIKNPGKKAALFLVMVLLLTPLLLLQSESLAYAATPTFKETKVEIVGEDETYQLEIKDKVDGSKYKWSSSNTKVARVSSKGIVTSVSKGSATIKCKITYPNKKTKTISCKVTVIVPATKIAINNAKEVNGAHIMKVGETYNFNRDIFPSGSSDKTYWAIKEGDTSCVEVTNSSSGIVKAVKPGKVTLVATAARKATEAEAAKSIVNDAIIIEVVEPTATVGSVEIVDSTVIKAVFDSPVDQSTVIGANNTLSENIDILLKTNIKGVTSSDPGKLTAQLSSDNKTLTITSTNRFEGEYGIYFSNKIKTTDGIAITEYYKLISYVDNVPPDILNVSMDDTGMIATIQFTEAIDFSGFSVTGASPLPGQKDTSADRNTISILNNKNNYIPSDDKKSLSINLSNIAYSDFNKTFMITLLGIKDLSGNTPAKLYLQAAIRPDNTPKPQARLLSVKRTAYDTLTATFDRSLMIGGYASLNNGSTMMGVIDEKDRKKVYFTLTEADAQKTGVQTISVSGWQSYNVDPKDTTSYQQHTRSVSFDVDKSNPILLKDEFDPKTNVLTLTYNREVTPTNSSGIFTATLVTISDEIYPNNNVTYTSLPSDDPKVIKLQLGNLTLMGNYTFTLEQTFARDSFRNYMLARAITISTSGGVDLELPAPVLITQSTSNPSLIYIEFGNMLDAVSAQTVSNYTIPGITITNARLEKNTKAEGATVVLTVADGSIDITLERPIIINGIKDYNGKYAPLTDYRGTVMLKENKKPYLMGAPVFDKARLNEIKFTFSEEVTGSMKVKVTQLGVPTPYEIGNEVTISGSNVVITLYHNPVQNSALRIDIVENKIADTSGNQSAAINPQYTIYVSY